MKETRFHWLKQTDNTFDHVAVNGEQVNVSVGYYRMEFGMDVAEEICGILEQYLRDRDMQRDEFWKEADPVSEIERLQQSIKVEEAENGI